LKKILLLDQGQPFQIDEYLHRPIGGSESSLMMLAKGFAELNNSAVILNNSKLNSRSFNLLQDNINLVNHFIKDTNIIIFNRFIDLELIKFIKENNKNIKLYYYSHDAYDQEITHWLLNKDLVNLFNKILLVSNWQKDTFIKYFNVDKDKLEVIFNGLDSTLFNGYVKRDLNKLIFASIPYKGLEYLDNIINDLVLRTKNENLKLHVFSSMKLYGREEDNSYDEIYRKLNNNKNIILRDVCSMKELAFELSSSNIYIHPNIYHETFGMVLTQAQAAGCDVVTTNLGATKEVVYDIDSCITKGYNIQLDKTYEDFIDLTISKLNLSNKERQKNVIKMQNFVSQFNYLNISKNVLKLF
jgi:glycosyltransferase involved in cell wall biosynthesis